MTGWLGGAAETTDELLRRPYLLDSFCVTYPLLWLVANDYPPAEEA